MRIFVIGDETRSSELAQKLGDGHEIDFAEPDDRISTSSLKDYDLIFDLNLDENPSHLQLYADLEKPVIGCAVKNSLASMVAESGMELNCLLIGMNALPTFINRDKTEISFLEEEDAKAALKIFDKLNWTILPVEDRVGMVTPRIIFMIINEAFYTVQEGTASADDIDKSMKLGTNYPLGPFEWSAKVGIQNVYETLEALYHDTNEERYKICPRLKKAYLKEISSIF